MHIHCSVKIAKASNAHLKSLTHFSSKSISRFSSLQLVSPLTQVLCTTIDRRTSSQLNCLRQWEESIQNFKPCHEIQVSTADKVPQIFWSKLPSSQAFFVLSLILLAMTVFACCGRCGHLAMN